MKPPIERLARRVPIPHALLLVAFVLVASWTWSWPDAALIPDEAISKAMVRSVAEEGTPFAREPIDDYRSGTFATDRYGSAYSDHEIVRPPVSIAVAFEQGLFGVKEGRLLTLGLGVLAVAFLATRIAGPWAGLFGGLLYLAHPATLYFHQSYFANSGGAAWFLVALALLEASRRWWWLPPLAVLAAGMALFYRPEYGLGLLVVVPMGFVLLKDRRAMAMYGCALVALFALLWNFESWFPSLTQRHVFTKSFPLAELFAEPRETLQAVLERYRSRRSMSSDAEWSVFAGHVNHYFVWFFPLTSLLAMVGLTVRANKPMATWIYAPLGVQTLLAAYAILPALAGFDFSNVSWLESSVVRYFLPTYALLSLLAGVALATLVDRVRASSLRLRPLAQPTAALLLAALVASSSIATALEAEHGVGWANERRAWFNDIEAAAVALDEKAVIVGKTPGKVVFERPVMNPENRGWDAKYATFVATDLIGKGHRVFALEPWYWNDHGKSIERILQHGGNTVWTDTGVVVDCTCGEFARFYELHVVHADLVNVARFDVGHFEDEEGGVRTAADVAHFYPERALHIQMGLARTKGVTVSITYADEGAATYGAGYWNLPLANAKNQHALVTWQTHGTGMAQTVTFDIPADEVANGALYIEGPPGLLVHKLEVRAA